MKILKNNLFVFLIDNSIFDDFKINHLFDSKQRYFLTLFSLKRQFKIKAKLLYPVHSILFFNYKKIDFEHEILIKNKDFILFFVLNNNLYSNNILDILFNKKLLDINIIKKFFFNFFFVLLNYLKFIFLIKYVLLNRKCQQLIS